MRFDRDAATFLLINLSRSDNARFSELVSGGSALPDKDPGGGGRKHSSSLSLPKLARLERWLILEGKCTTLESADGSWIASLALKVLSSFPQGS